MTFSLEQFSPAQAHPRDETAERLFWDARKFGQVNPPEVPNNAFELQIQGFPQSDLLLAKIEPTERADGRTALESAIEKLSPERRERFHARMEEFESRATAARLSSRQVDATYAQIRRLLESPADSLTAEQRLNIAEQVITMAADPTSIDQGVHDTCGAAVLEVRTYLRHPEKAVQLVTDVALTGKVVAPGGTALNIDVTPHDTSKLAFPKSGQRSHASEIFQVTAINLALNSKPGVREGSLAYIQKDRRPETVNLGEMVIDYSENPPREKKFEGLYVADVLRMNKLVTGHDEPDLVMWKARQKGDRQYGAPFTTQSEMEKLLLEAKRNGKLPAVLYVYSGNDPLWQDAPNNADGGRGSGHFINVTDIQPGKPPRVEIDSTWWRRADHTKNTGKSLSLNELYLASLEPADAEFELKRQVDEDRLAGKIDTARQVALVRQEWVNGKIDTDGLESGLRELLLLSGVRWNTEKSAGRLDPSEQRRSLAKTMEAVDRLPYANKLRMLETLKNSGVIDDREYISAIISTGNEMAEHRMMMTFAGELDAAGELGYRRAQDELAKRLSALPPEARRSAAEQLKRGQNTDVTGFFAGRAHERRERRKL